MLTKYWDGLTKTGELEGVSAQEVEVIVVDNADEPEVEKFARDQCFGYLPMGSNVGLSAANNRGAEVATGDYLLFANPDLAVRVSDLPILQAEIDRTGGIVTPRVDFADGRPQSAARGEPYFFAKLAHRGLAPKVALERYLWRVGPYESGPVVWCAGERLRCLERYSTGSVDGPRNISSTWRTWSSASVPAGWAYRFRSRRLCGGCTSGGGTVGKGGSIGDAFCIFAARCASTPATRSTSAGQVSPRRAGRAE
jgi:hypothetical protein